MIDSMIAILLENPLLLLFMVAAVGYPLGKLQFGGLRLGVAMVLFVGLGFGALHPDMRLPDLVYQLGLIIFVYTIGLSSGRLFFASLRRTGLRDNGFVVALLVLAAAAAYGAALLGDFSAALGAGLFAGSLTNTPALASILEALGAAGATPDELLNQAVVAYSIAYPMGVVGMMAAIVLVQRVFKIDYVQDEQQAQLGAGSRLLENRTVRVTQAAVVGHSIQQLDQQHRFDVVFGRMQRHEELSLTTGATVLHQGDLLSVVGTTEELERVTEVLGEDSGAQLELDRRELDYRRIFVSNPAIAGHRLRDLNLPQHLGAVVTRLRRGDIEMLVHGDTVIELGDRVRVVARREHMPAITTFFGDSYKALSEIDILSFNLGLALGLLVGLIPLPLPGDTTIRLGFAGGPLVVALILGALTRTGPLVWHLPYNANLTLRQTGLVLFLAGIGTRAGYSFFSTLAQGGAGLVFLAGALISFGIAVVLLWIGYKLLRIPMGLLVGILAGFQTQPALLGFALEQTNNELPNIGYARVFPIALITKILLAQILLTLLS